VLLGKTSYSIYLWHWPLICYWKYLQIKFEGDAKFGIVLLSLLLGYLSWRLVEGPIRQRKFLASDRALTLFLGLSSVSALSVGYTVWFSEGFPGRWSTTIRSIQVNNDLGRFRDGPDLLELQAGKRTLFGTQNQDDPLVVIWGDSQAVGYLAGLDPLCKRLGIRGVGFVGLGKPPFDRGTGNPDEAPRLNLIRDEIRKHRPALLILVWSWSR